MAHEMSCPTRTPGSGAPGTGTGTVEAGAARCRPSQTPVTRSTIGAAGTAGAAGDRENRMTMTPPRWRPAHPLLLVASMAMIGAVVTVPAPSVAASATSTVIAGEKVSISGKLASRGKRPVVLERFLHKRWTRVVASRTTSRGRYTFVVTMPHHSAGYRVVAPRTRVHGKVLAARVSTTRRYAVAPQRATLTLPSAVVEGRRVGAQATFSPARPGRPVALHQLVDGAWTTIATSVQDAHGRASFKIAQQSTSTYRAVTPAWRGAAARGTASRTTSVTSPADDPWVTGYYAGWFWDQMYPPEHVDMSAMTHFVFGRVAPGAGSIGGRAGTVVEAAGTAHDPHLSPDGTRSVEDYLVKKAHDAGAKALLMLGGDGNDGAGFVLSSDDAVRAQFVDRVVDYLVEHDYDGVDVDWENCLDGARGCGEATNAAPVTAHEAQRRLLALLVDIRAEAATRERYRSTPVLVTFPGYPVNTNFLTDGKVEPWQAEVANLVDQYNLMSYGIGTTWSGAGWLSWFSGALTGAGPRTPVDIESSIAAYVRSGVPRSRLGIGIGFYGIYFGPRVTGPRQETDRERIYEVNDVALAYSELVRKGYLRHGAPKWDEPAQSTYRTYGSKGYVPANDRRANPAGFLSYEDARSIAAKGQWVKDSGVGGTIIWTLNYGWLPSSRSNPLLEAVKKAFIKGS
ncbi:glycoside hydrolase family 18 protein [Aeromicrobium sp. UC242_57]